MIDIESRLRYYLNSFYNKKLDIIIDSKLYEFEINKPFFYRGSNYSIYQNNPKMNPCFWFQHPDFCINIPCIAISSDGYDNYGLPAFTKARQIGKHNNGILMKLNIPRHWSILDRPPKDISWKEKIDSVVWRGNHVCGNNKKPNRFNLVEKYGISYNIKFWSGADITGYCDEHQKYYHDHKNLFATEFMPIENQLLYKYIVCMEGNDVATSLKWILNSNSLAIMPKPQIESWLMEGLLIPWEHYVPLSDRLDNLEEILEWCCSNDAECEKIAKNATEFMKQFKNFENEKLIFDSIIEQYRNNIEFIVT